MIKMDRREFIATAIAAGTMILGNHEYVSLRFPTMEGDSEIRGFTPGNEYRVLGEKDGKILVRDDYGKVHSLYRCCAVSC